MDRCTYTSRAPVMSALVDLSSNIILVRPFTFTEDGKLTVTVLHLRTGTGR